MSSPKRVTDWQGLAGTPLNQWHLHLRNDFEVGIREQHSAVDELLTWMAEAGADHVQMTGTGSTVFGLFKDQASAKRAETMCKEARQGLVGLERWAVLNSADARTGAITSGP